MIKTILITLLKVFGVVAFIVAILTILAGLLRSRLVPGPDFTQDPAGTEGSG